MYLSINLSQVNSKIQQLHTNLPLSIPMSVYPHLPLSSEKARCFFLRLAIDLSVEPTINVTSESQLSSLEETELFHGCVLLEMS